MTRLPKELLKELPHYTEGRETYTAKELVLSLLANATEPVTTREMMIYVYKVNKTVIKRTYLYQMLYRLRAAGLVVTLRSREGSTKTFGITEEGRIQARPYIEVKGE